MSPLYLLDTNILVHLVRQDAIGLRIKELYDPLMASIRPAISVVTAGQLRSLAYTEIVFKVTLALASSSGT
jgi:predicted nucleic acid-binding protein